MRYVWPITMWTSVAVTLLLCGLIVRSRRSCDIIAWSSQTAFGSAISNQYRVHVIWIRQTETAQPSNPRHWIFQTIPDRDMDWPPPNYSPWPKRTSDKRDPGDSEATWTCLGLTYSTNTTNYLGSQTWQVSAPIAYFIAPFPLVALWALRQSRRGRARDRRERGQCTACGYDLRATPERCPECGAVVATNGAVEVKS